MFSKSSKGTIEAFLCVQPKTIICDHKLIKAIDRKYFDVAHSLITIPRFLPATLLKPRLGAGIF